MARRPHGERSALEKFLKSKGSGLGCRTRPSLCAHIVSLIKGAGPGKAEPVSRRLGRLLGNAQGPSLPQAPGPGKARGRRASAWREKDEARRPEPLQRVSDGVLGGVVGPLDGARRGAQLSSGPPATAPRNRCIVHPSRQGPPASRSASGVGAAVGSGVGILFSGAKRLQQRAVCLCLQPLTSSRRRD